MWLSSIINGLDFVKLKGDPELEVSSIAFDSRMVTEGGVFVAIAGHETDGHLYIGSAIERGAAVVIVERDVETEAPLTVLQVKDTRNALARLSATYYGNPTESLNLIGVTGTNGKTSITYLIQSILEKAGRSVGLIGSMGTLIGGLPVKSRNTTPESLFLQQLFAKMREEQIDDCVMEVSSHALSLSRTAYCHFTAGIFTNLTPDHLELHQTMEEYFEAKSRLFDMTGEANIVNTDDPYGRRLIDRLRNKPARLITYGVRSPSDIYATGIRHFENGSDFIAQTPIGSIPIRIHLPGLIYVYNTLAAIAYAISAGIGAMAIQAGIEEVKGVKGRLETVYQDENRKVIVDFAHTEDGLEKAIRTVRPFVRSRIILVFGVYGAEGEYGKRKRRAMGRVAAEYADLPVVTSDNPRNQNAHEIIHEIVEGIEQGGGEYRSFVDRKDAIHFALDECRSGDVVLITGKGHETTQKLGGVEIPFNEREIVAEYMAKKRKFDKIRTPG